MLGTVPFVLTGDPLPEALLIAALFLWGVGLGAVVPPNVAATCTPAATSARTVLNRVGGSVGTAVLAVILQDALAGGGAGPQTAYAHTFGWALAFGVLSLVPAALYPRRAPGRS
ncbi:hypothetical protein ACIA8H_29240 [Streptomyces goshikiensis]|uniref:hypothetical protein n=1 Tax=Streptomyces goshikiensis TaxID=1942 RepID=UPI0037A064A8